MTVLAEPAVPLLQVRGLTIGIRRADGSAPIVRGVNLDVYPAERVGVVGESGSGKSLTLLALMGLLPPPLEVLDGSVRLAGRELVGAPERVLRDLRGREMSMVYQDPMTSLDPVLRVGEQVAEGLRAHGVPRNQAWRRAVAALGEVGLPDPEQAARAYPHELSGGMRQRVMIAAALVGEPALLIADEPTTALDVTIQRQILRLVVRLQRQHHTAVLWVTHDLGVVAQFAQRLAVMYAGRIVETGTTGAVFTAPQHPYTAALLAAVPSARNRQRALTPIPGAPPDPARLAPGCPFAPRCAAARDRCHAGEPDLIPKAAAAQAACWFPPSQWRNAYPPAEPRSAPPC
jgi:oligopeptide/dipeptide ABC transporter ATP-binding protein